MASTMIPIPADISKSTGPLVLGYILNWGLYGGLCVQVYYYYVAFPKDRAITKGLVFGLFLLETVQSIFIAHDIFATFATGYGNIAELVNPQFSWLTAPVMTGIVSCTVQIYFAYRIYVISGSKIPGIIIVLLALMQGISAIVGGIQLLRADDLRTVQVRAHTSTTIWLLGSVVCDIIIAVFMVYFLSQRATGIKATQVLITKIMRLTIETGSLTAIVAIIDVVLFLASPNNNFHIAPALVLGKLYSNSLVTTLNSRLRIVNSRNDISIDEMDSYRLENSGRIYVDNLQRGQVSGINVWRKDDQTVTVNTEREVWTIDNPIGRLNGQQSTRDEVGAMEGLA